MGNVYEMKKKDWNGHKIPVLAHVFNLAKGLGVDLHISAASEHEARSKVAEKLNRNQKFLRRTNGHYDVQFSKEII